LLAFGLVTALLAVAVETVKPEWRDPEYGHRLRQVRRWQRARPERPLVLVLGSSRTQNGVSPKDMSFEDRPGSPLVYNFGYRGAHPLGVWLQASRLLDDGVRPRAVLIQLAGTELRTEGSAEFLYVQYMKWGPRFSAADSRRFGPFTEDPAVFDQAVFSNRRNPWVTRREAVVADLLPNWQQPAVRAAHGAWEFMDRYGFFPLPAVNMNTEEFARSRAAELANHRPYLNLPVGETTKRAMLLLISRLQGEGIPVALFWMPESPTYRSTMYSPAARATDEGFARQLAAEKGVPIFPAPEHLSDDDFADGYHPLPDGAAKYSRWLADNHLKPWLAEVLK
jgi:hypothetical protein